MPELPRMPDKPRVSPSSSPPKSGCGTSLAFVMLAMASWALFFGFLSLFDLQLAIVVSSLLVFLVGGILLSYLLWGRGLYERLLAEEAAETERLARENPAELAARDRGTAYDQEFEGEDAPWIRGEERP
ncbi:MAG: hypothetical protein SFX18_20225 [Pirellulales bacterium]|nr:hypothetical protein [Pirellulales bacterium]